jgi:hypothetical protein
MERIRAVLAARMAGNRRRLNRPRHYFVFLRKLIEKQGAPRRGIPGDAWTARRAAMEPAPVYHQNSPMPSIGKTLENHHAACGKVPTLC